MHKTLSNLYWTAAVVWYILGIILHLSGLPYMITHREPALLVLLGLWWAVTLIVRKIRHTIEKKRREKEARELQEYRDRFITEIPVEDSIFGKAVFEYDSSKNKIGTSDYPLEKPFGRHELSLDCELSGSDPEPAVRAIRWVFEHSGEILEELYAEMLEYCISYDERNKNGELYDMEYVRENLNIYSLCVYGDADDISFRICSDIYGDDRSGLIGGHAVVAFADLKPEADGTLTGKIDFMLEG